jgi:K+-sensing histidine kinase KdpD
LFRKIQLCTENSRYKIKCMEDFNKDESEEKKSNLQNDFIAEIANLSNRLRKAEHIKSHFLSNVRNEINNPLTAIIGLSESMRDAENIDQAKLRHWANAIQKEVFDLNFLITNIFIAAEIEAGTIIPQASDINIDALIADQINFLKRKINDLGVDIILQIEPIGKFKTDGQLLERILVNFLYETLQCSGEGQQILLQTHIHNNRLTVTLEYAGIRIETSSDNNIFDRLGHYNYSLANPGGNCGLTVSIVKDLTDKLDGTIIIESTTNNFNRINLTIPELTAVVPDYFSFDDRNMFFGQEEIL